MTKRELLARLALFPDDAEVMVRDSYGPRTINSGPFQHEITAAEADDSADCEDRTGETVILMGYGSY